MPTVFHSEPAEYIVEHSRFIGKTFHLRTAQELDRCVFEVQHAYPKANHYCFAYRISDSRVRASDDGEPQGTAGLPMLNILSRENWEETLIIVVRYFGGIKLGRGGLVHAYQQAAQLALKRTVPGQRTFVRQVTFQIDYAAYERVTRALATCVLAQNAEFAAEVTLTVTLPNEVWPTAQAALDQETAHRWVMLESSVQAAVLPLSAPANE